MVEILFVTAGSYSDYHILGAFVGEQAPLSEIKRVLDMLYDEISDIETKYYSRDTSESEKAKLRPILQQKRDLISYENFIGVALKYGVDYIDQCGENTVRYDRE
jgi:hypothetical protein